MKNSNETIGNRTRDLPTCSAVAQPTGPLRTLKLIRTLINIYIHIYRINVTQNFTDDRKYILSKINGEDYYFLDLI